MLPNQKRLPKFGPSIALLNVMKNSGMKKTAGVILLTGATILSVAFTNCSKVDFGVTAASKAGDTNGAFEEPPIVPTTPDVPPAVEEAIKNCAEAISSGKILSAQQKVEFKDSRVDSGRKQVCEFSKGENLSPLDQYLRARYDQEEKLKLPAGAVICGIELKSDVQKFKYDDVFFLTFNNQIIASNLKKAVTLNSVESMSLTNGQRVPFYNYDWLKVRGDKFSGINNVADDYCLGSEQGQSSCKWPLSQQSGVIQFTFNPEMLIHLGLKESSANQRFGFTITGDNDKDLDCYHEALSFDMNVKYYIQK